MSSTVSQEKPGVQCRVWGGGCMVSSMLRLSFFPAPSPTACWCCLITWIQLPQSKHHVLIQTHSNREGNSQKKRIQALDAVAWWIECGLWTKGLQFDSQSVHIPELPARFPIWGLMRGSHTLMFLSLSFSLPSPLSNFFKEKDSLIYERTTTFRSPSAQLFICPKARPGSMATQTLSIGQREWVVLSSSVSLFLDPELGTFLCWS